MLSSSRSLVRLAGAVALALMAFAATGRSEAQDIPLYYYNGISRVDLVASPTELVVLAEKGGRIDTAPLSSRSAGGRAEAIAAGHAIVTFANPVTDRDGIVARGRALRGAGGTVAVVAFRPEGGRGPESRVFIPNRFSLRPAGGHSIESLARDYGFAVIEKLSFAQDTYIVETASGDLLAGLDAANAIVEAGRAHFATPLVLEQHMPRLIPNDSYFANQWHLRNTGQVSGIPGNDVNIVGAWDSFTGAGINIAITDSGVQWFHTDLSANARTDIDLDINGGDDDPAPQSQSHGTSVAGIAAAKGQNGLGVVGAAFDAGIVGIRLIESSTTDLEDATALQHQANEATPSDYVHINSNSWGPSDNGQNLSTFGPLTEAALINGVTNGRGGKGIVYVWAAGNGRQNDDNVNYDGFASSRYVIAVGATGANGVVSYYSEPGASMLVNVPSSYASTGTTTTTFMNGGTLGAHYTNSFGGTSSAAPLVSGIVALMLDANPNLSWRDVQHVLVETAEQNDPGDQGWVTNGDGHLFNHNYGFGRVDATAAVNLAQTWTSVPQEATPITGSRTVGLPIPDSNVTGVSSTITVSGASATWVIEHVEVVFNAIHPFRTDLEVRLVAPSGQVSVLAQEHAGSGSNFSNWKFTTVADWGENPNGAWTLQVMDLDSGSTGTFTSWSLAIRGYDANPPPPDADSDLLPDEFEDDTGTFVDETQTGTDPNNPDSDGDGVLDGIEVDLGTDPNNPLDFPQLPVSRGVPLILVTAALLLAAASRTRLNAGSGDRETILKQRKTAGRRDNFSDFEV